MRSRRILGFVLLLLTPCLLLAAALLISEAVQRSPGGEISDRLNGASVTFMTDRTRTTFNGDCIALAWTVEGAAVREIYVVDAPAMGSGTMQNCDGTTPRLRVVFDDSTSRTWTIPVHRTFDDPTTALRAWLLLAPSVVCLIAGVWLSRIYQSRLLSRPAVQIALVVAFAVGWVVVLDLFTNSLNIYRYVWDHYHYIDMAQNGIRGNEALVAPYAYRPIVPLLAGVIGRVTERSVLAGFRAVTYAGLISQLVLIYVLARQFTRQQWAAWVVMLVAAISTYHVKFLLFDIYRPDSLAFTLILIGMLAFVRRQRLVTARQMSNAAVGVQRAAPLQPDHSPGAVLYTLIILLTSALGLLVREFCALPAALLAARLLLEFVRTRRLRPLLEALGIVAVIGLAYWLPQKLISVGRSDQFLSSDLSNLWDIVSNIPRSFNILLGAAIYLLPLLVLLTPPRARRLWARLGDHRLDMALYVVIVLALALVGGSDIVRFVVYLFVPVIILLALLLDDGMRPAEVIYALLATAVYNRILSPIPQESLEAYLDFYIVWFDRTSPVTWLRAGELLLWILGAFALRRWIAKDQTAADAETIERRV